MGIKMQFWNIYLQNSVEEWSKPQMEFRLHLWKSSGLREHAWWCKWLAEWFMVAFLGRHDNPKWNTERRAPSSNSMCRDILKIILSMLMAPSYYVAWARTLLCYFKKSDQYWLFPFTWTSVPVMTILKDYLEVVSCLESEICPPQPSKNLFYRFMP